MELHTVCRSGSACLALESACALFASAKHQTYFQMVPYIHYGFWGVFRVNGGWEYQKLHETSEDSEFHICFIYVSYMFHICSSFPISIQTIPLFPRFTPQWPWPALTSRQARRDVASLTVPWCMVFAFFWVVNVCILEVLASDRL
jgi:hypothetical protein